MRSTLFDHSHQGTTASKRFELQNPQMLRVSVDADVLAAKGTMVAYQGELTFRHESAGSIGKLLKKVVTNEDLSLMRVSGRGEVFLANEAGYAFLIELEDETLSVGAHNLLAFDPTLGWDVKRTRGAAALASGLFSTTLTGTGTMALATVGKPVVLDCSLQPTYVDVNAAVAWSGGLRPNVVSSMNARSLLRGGTGEAFQYAFYGPGFVVVQPYEFVTAPTAAPTSTHSAGGLMGDLFR